MSEVRSITSNEKIIAIAARTGISSRTPLAGDSGTLFSF
jgi:hypothetical protein